MNENYQFLVYIFASGFIGTGKTKQKYYGYGLDAFLGAQLCWQ
jgi:hypothetical protein